MLDLDISYNCFPSPRGVSYPYMDIYANKPVNTIETKLLCGSSSNLADVLTMREGCTLLFPCSSIKFHEAVTERRQICSANQLLGWPSLLTGRLDGKKIKGL